MNGSSSASPGGQSPEKAARLGAALIDGGVAIVLTVLLGGLPYLGGVVGAIYLMVRDSLNVGPLRSRSVGKHLMGLRLIRLDGAPVTLETSLLRNWMFGVGAVAGLFAVVPFVGGLLAPIVTLGGLVLIFYEVFNVFRRPAGRRWGDRIGGTKVVEDGSSIL